MQTETKANSITNGTVGGFKVPSCIKIEIFNCKNGRTNINIMYSAANQSEKKDNINVIIKPFIW